jgi:diguanylate cyclase (GGDEF)-like protein
MGVLDLLPLAMLRAERTAGAVGVVTDANAAALHLLGLSRAEALGSTVGDLLGTDETIPVGGAGVQVRHPRVGDPPAAGWLAISVMPMPAGSSDGTPGRDDVLVVMHDISAHKAVEARLDRAARHDPLTGLINRSELVRLLAALDPHDDGPNVAVIYLDLDGFKLVNDSRGHQVGDELLVAVARRIRAAIRPEDSLARLGGDEFVVVCPRLADPADARAVAERVRATLDTPVSIEGREHRISMSLGISLSRSGRVNPPELLRQADMAMYRAKDAGRNTIRIHSAEMDAELVAEELVRDALGAALAGGAGPDVAGSVAEDRAADAGSGLVLHFQPIVEIGTGELAYVEALARLRDAEGSLVYPSAFLPVAARAGLNGALSEHVLRRALQQRARWRAQGVDVPMGLNLARGQVFSGSFAGDALRIIREEGDVPSAVVFEMGEFGLLEATGPAQLTLRRLRTSGIGLAIDHFGTGYSSLGALRFLGPHRVKIDRSFVSSITASAADRAIVTAAISAAHALGQRVVAEGVETAQQLDVLAGLGCDEAQGFLIAQVLPATELDLAAIRWEPGTLRRVGG